MIALSYFFFSFQTFDPVSSLNFTPTEGNFKPLQQQQQQPPPQPPSVLSFFTGNKDNNNNNNKIAKYGEQNQSAIIDAYLGQRRDGFFVEAGAWDGEYLSNTKFFEKERNWTGLLVEPNKAAFR